jgi:hypothetical protein
MKWAMLSGSLAAAAFGLGACEPVQSLALGALPGTPECPGNDQSAGKRRSGRTRKGSKNLNIALKDAAMAATRTNDSYLQALYRRKRSALGHGRAVGAVKHSMICACWHMLATGEIYTDLGGDYYQRRDPERQTRRLVAQLQRLGHTVTLQDTKAA